MATPWAEYTLLLVTWSVMVFKRNLMGSESIKHDFLIFYLVFTSIGIIANTIDSHDIDMGRLARAIAQTPRTINCFDEGRVQP